MKKVILASEMARVEKLAYQEKNLEEQFMRNAAYSIAHEIKKNIDKLLIKPKMGFLIGKGNNGGDGILAAKLLAQDGLSVKAYFFSKFDQSSSLNQTMRKEFESASIPFTSVDILEDFVLDQEEFLIDALFGTGYQGKLSSLLESVFKIIKQKQIPVISIDIPSGINGDEGKKNDAIEAKKTLFLGAAKWGCFLENAFDHLGNYEILDFGLPDAYLDQANVMAYLFSIEDAKKLLPVIVRTRHKYQAGYVLGIAGSKSMPGAAILASIATLRVGAGIMRLFHPKEMENTSLEILREEFDIKRIEEEQKRAKAIFIGPGMGRDEKALHHLKDLLRILDKPTVIDADALYLIGRYNLSFPPSILTPHMQEMKHLLGKDDYSYSDFLLAVENYSKVKNSIIVLKGAPTRVFIPNEKQIIITEGDAALATAGTGDVLTGMIAGFLAQNLKPRDAALLGVFVHGLAGRLGAEKLTSYSVIASDLFAYIPKALAKIKKTK